MGEDGGSFDLCGECGLPLVVAVAIPHEVPLGVEVRIACSGETCDFEMPLVARLTEGERRRAVSLGKAMDTIGARRNPAS